jgi:hypothetical protein
MTLERGHNMRDTPFASLGSPQALASPGSAGKVR